MAFQKKDKTVGAIKIDPIVIPSAGNESVSTEKKEKKESSVSTDVKAQREIYEKNQEIEKLKQELEDAKQAQAIINPPTQAPSLTEIETLKAQLNLLASQIRTGATGDKLRFRQPTALDLIPAKDAITFTARAVYYIVGSYMDKDGIEQLPPFKLITFLYAASDIRKDGPEETIKSFSTYTTRLKPEIDFLRASPYYNVAFGENTNEMMKEENKEVQFRTNAATALQSFSPEDIFAKAEQLKIPNYRNRSASELKGPIMLKMVEEYKQEEERIQKEIIQRNMLRQQPVEQE